jgi:hypothetical protein
MENAIGAQDARTAAASANKTNPSPNSIDLSAFERDRTEIIGYRLPES